jgi:hypothetical protein
MGSHSQSPISKRSPIKEEGGGRYNINKKERREIERNSNVL